MANQLSDFIRYAAVKRMRPGHWDCGFWLADWIALRTGQDPAAMLRGMPEDVWLKLAARLPITVGRALRAVGVKPTKTPVPGDVAVLRVGSTFVGGIRTGVGWAVLSENGVACSRTLDRAVVRAWAIHA